MRGREHLGSTLPKLGVFWEGARSRSGSRGGTPPPAVLVQPILVTGGTKHLADASANALSLILSRDTPDPCSHQDMHAPVRSGV